MAKKLTIVIGILLALAFVFVAAQKGKNPPTTTANGTPILTWDDLREYDYKANVVPEKLKALNNKKIKIGGYPVPFDDEYTTLSEFYFIPMAQVCIHDKLPPPNLIIHVKLAQSLPREKVYNPAWIEGTFTIDPATNQHGTSSYKLNDATLDEYKD